MTTDDVRNEPEKFAVGVGRLVRQHRQAAGVTAEQLADAAQFVGLDWSRATVTDVEGGRRDLPATELLLLPLVLDRAGVEVTLADLLPEQAAMTKLGTTAGRRGLLDVIEGKPTGVGPGRWQYRAAGEVLGRVREAARETLDLLPKRATLGEVVVAEHDCREEAVRKAARVLDVEPVQVAYAARRRWGKSFTAEREVRTAERTTPETSQRSAQGVRAHVTRDLIFELRPIVAKFPKAVR